MVVPFKNGMFRVLLLRFDDKKDHHPQLEDFDAALTDCLPGVTCHDPVWMTSFRLHQRNVRQYRVGQVKTSKV